jgi:cofilin
MKYKTWRTCAHSPQSSGIEVDDECVTTFMELKLRKKFRYIIYRLSDNNLEIIVDKKVEKCDKYDDFIAELPETDCRYAVYDFEYEKSPAEGMRNKICFVVWVPDGSTVRQKMIYASSKDAIRKKLAGIAVEIQATDMSEIEYDSVLEKVKGH